MLVLSRHKDEAIKMRTENGIEINLLVVEIRGDKARLGITAPRSVTIHRQEVWDAIQRKNASKLG